MYRQDQTSEDNIPRLAARRTLLRFIFIPMMIELAMLTVIVLIYLLGNDLYLRGLQILLLINIIIVLVGLFLVVTSTARENAAQALLTTSGAFRMKTQEDVLALRRKEIRREMSSWLASVLILGQGITYLLLTTMLFVVFEVSYLYLLLGTVSIGFLYWKDQQYDKQLMTFKKYGLSANHGTPSEKKVSPLDDKRIHLELDIIRGIKSASILLFVLFISYMVQIMTLATTDLWPVTMKVAPFLLNNQFLVLTPFGQKKLNLFEAISGLFIIMFFSTPVIILFSVPIILITGFLIERWMITFKHSPRDSTFDKFVMMTPFLIGMMIILGFLGLTIQIISETGEMLLLETLITNFLLGVLLTPLAAWSWWHHVMQHDFKGGIMITRKQFY